MTELQRKINSGALDSLSKVAFLFQRFSPPNRPSHITKDSIMTVNACMVFPKNSILRPIFDKVIFNVKKFGLMMKWAADIKAKIIKNEPNISELKLKSFHGVLFLSLSGLLLAIVVFFIEVLVGKLSRRKNKNVK